MPITVHDSEEQRIGQNDNENITLLKPNIEPEGHLFASYYAHRYLYLASGCFASFFTTGVIYGWPLFLQMLERESIYFALCSEQEILDSKTCSDRDLRFSTIFSVASFTLLTSVFLSGIVLDYAGPKLTASIRAFLGFCGAILLAFANDKSFDSFGVGFTLFAAGGPPVHVAQISYSNLFPFHKATIISILNGFFSFSAYTFIIFDALHTSKSFDFQQLFLMYAGLLFFIFCANLYLIPRRTLNIPESFHFDVSSNTKSTQIKANTEKWGWSFWEQLKAREYYLMLVWAALSLLKLQYYIGSAPNDLIRLGDNSGAYRRMLGALTPLGGVGVFVYGKIMDKYGYALAALMVTALGGLLNAFAMVEVLEVQIVTFLLWGFYRTFFFSLSYSVLAYLFGFKNFGKLIGLALFAGGIFALTQVGFTKIAVALFDGELFYIMGFFFVMSFFLAFYPIYLFAKGI